MAGSEAVGGDGGLEHRTEADKSLVPVSVERDDGGRET